MGILFYYSDLYYLFLETMNLMIFHMKYSLHYEHKQLFFQSLCLKNYQAFNFPVFLQCFSTACKLLHIFNI